MAQSSKRIQVDELDFDNIKSNLKNFLKAQSQFSDYDFEGSSLSILLDILSYNTHYNALYTNLAINEMFLDSASKRSSVVSLAKQLGYTPNSAKAARAVISATITAPTSSPTLATLPALTPFSTKIDGQTFKFYNQEEITVLRTNGAYVFPEITLVEGIPLSSTIVVATGQQYIIQNAMCDISTLKVLVQESATSDSYTVFYPATSVIDIDSTSNVYWVKEIDNGKFELTFGDGLTSASLTNGNVVHLSYFVTNADLANNARSFAYAGSNLLGSSLSTTTLSIASGGAQPEDIESIRFNAPRTYAAQNRAVTPSDYKALILSKFTDASSVVVWGGEDNNPPVYGKVFICVKPKTAAKLTVQQKSDITTTILNSKNVVSIKPEIVDPDYINISVDTTVYYNDRETNRSASDIASLVTASIIDYNDTELQLFDGILRYSKFSRMIDLSEPSIANSISTITLHRQISPRYNTSAEYNINLINPIYTSGVAEDSLTTTGFYIYGDVEEKVHYLTDSGDGYVQLYYETLSTNTSAGTQTTTRVIVEPKIGTIDYANGIINIKNLNITAIEGSVLEFSIKPQSNDVVSAYTQIAQIDTSRITVTAIPDATLSGDIRAGKNYKFASSRS